jgi:hypothetical protein
MTALQDIKIRVQYYRLLAENDSVLATLQLENRRLLIDHRKGDFME